MGWLPEEASQERRRPRRHDRGESEMEATDHDFTTASLGGIADEGVGAPEIFHVSQICPSLQDVFTPSEHI